MTKRSVAVVGAGLAGLACARKLVAEGLGVVVFEKSGSLGGRCATRFWNGHVIDHGAQYLTLVDPLVRADLEAVVARRHLRVLESPVVDIKSGEAIPSPKGERYYYEPGNSRIGKALAAGLDIRLRTPVAAVEKVSGGRWMVAGETFELVVVTCPYPQAALLVGTAPARVNYLPCLTVLVEYNGAFAGDSALRYAWADGGGGHDLAWSACENHKVGRVEGDRTVFVIQASAHFSAEFLEAPPETYVPILRSQLESLWSIDGRFALDTFTHRWRYARLADAGRALDPAEAEVGEGVYLAGDALGGSRVEAAWRSGLDVAGRVLSR